MKQEIVSCACGRGKKYNSLWIGKRYNRWLIIGGPTWKGKRCYYLCRCVCGAEKPVSISDLRMGKSKGCRICQVTKHGDAHLRIYQTWVNLKHRCEAKTSTAYKNYGERGITVCVEWDDYKTFKAWATTNGYSDDLIIDRIDNGKGYYPENCRWVDYKTNLRNKRTNRRIYVFGETKCLVEWAEDKRCKISRSCLTDRLNRGWLPERALITPTKGGQRCHYDQNI